MNRSRNQIVSGEQLAGTIVHFDTGILKATKEAIGRLVVSPFLTGSVCDLPCEILEVWQTRRFAHRHAGTGENHEAIVAKGREQRFREIDACNPHGMSIVSAGSRIEFPVGTLFPVG